MVLVDLMNKQHTVVTHSTNRSRPVTKIHLSRIKERAGNTTEPTENTEEPIGITVDNIIKLYDTRKPPAALYTYTSHIDVT